MRGGLMDWVGWLIEGDMVGVMVVVGGKVVWGRLVWRRVCESGSKCFSCSIVGCCVSWS